MEQEIAQSEIAQSLVVDSVTRLTLLPSVTRLTLLPIALLVIVGLFFIASKLNGRGWALLGGGFLMMLVMWLVIALAFQHHARRVVLEDVDVAQAERASTEAMWAHLNRNRIVMDVDHGNKSTEEESVADAPFLAPLEEQKQPKKKRPDWFDNPPKRVGNVYRVVVSAGPYRDAQECHRALEPKLEKVVKNRIQQVAGAHHTPTLRRLGLRTDYIFSDICRQEWTEQTEASFGEMTQVHVLMEFDAAVDKHLRDAYRSYLREYRIEGVGSIAGLALGGLALLFGLLKLDTYTRGYYTKRLFFGVPAAIIVLVMLTAS